MTPLVQTILHSKAEGTRGNCLAACVAMILDLPIEEVPNFADHGLQWFAVLRDWLRPRGFTLVQVPASETFLPSFGTPVIVGGTSPRGGGVRHAIVRVYDADGEVEFDPHPDGTGLAVVEDFLLIVQAGREVH